MTSHNRRQFLRSCATASSTALAAELGFLAPLSRAASHNTQIKPELLSSNSSTNQLVQLINRTPRANCVQTMVAKVRDGLSYQQFLAALFLTASRTNNLHILAQVYAAHRISSRARIEERLLPLFWSLDRIKESQENQDASNQMGALSGPFPSAGEAEGVYQSAMKSGNKPDAERAILVLAQSAGPRAALMRLWQDVDRDLGGTMGHLPIGAANAFRTLSEIGWEYSIPGLRYLAREICRKSVDSTYHNNRERVSQHHAQIPLDWTATQTDREATVDLYQIFREGSPDETGDAIIEALQKNSVKAASVWDAISLTAADLIFRFETGGGVIGGNLIHAITSTNAMRFGFNLHRAPRKRLMILLQAAAILPSFFLRWPREEGKLRSMNLVEDLPKTSIAEAKNVSSIFENLPFKSNHHDQADVSERIASDLASRQAYSLLTTPKQQELFQQTARSFLCRKATSDPHDFKYPAAAFEDATLVSAEWRPYLLASTVHALHGPKSTDSQTLIAARNALV